MASNKLGVCACQRSTHQLGFQRAIVRNEISCAWQNRALFLFTPGVLQVKLLTSFKLNFHCVTAGTEEAAE